MSRSEIQSKAQQLESGDMSPKGKPRFIYGEDGEFDVVAVCPRTLLPDHCIPLAYPTARAWPDGMIKRIPWTEDRLRDALQETFRKIRSVYGGEWILSIWRARRLTTPQDRITGARAEAERRILAGPDTPGRRWLQQHKGLMPDLKVVPPLENPQAATRDMIDRLQDRPERPQPVQATAEWFEQEGAEQRLVEAREPGQEG